jgi:uncharacterized membrane-anchored protein
MNFSQEHPLRQELHNELHARPSLYFEGDIDVWHVAILGDASPSVLKTLVSLPDVLSTQNGKHGTGSVAGGRLKWELHTEFLTLTLVIAAADPVASAPKSFQRLCADTRGEIIAAVRVLARDEREGKAIVRPQPDFVASEVGGGDAEVHSNFRLDDSGFVEFFLINRNLNAYRTGRMVRRLLEIETYRMMALLAMPVAKETARQLAAFDGRLNDLVGHMQNAAKVDKALLSQMTKLSSEVLNFSAAARQRFGATKAYAEIVTSRIQELREGRVEQRQRLGTFIDRRFQPAISSCRAAERRLDDLIERVSLAGDLLRTTIQVQLEDQNASLLSSMEERTRAQVHIQQAVEGFSVIAISYYAISLAKLGFESFSAFGLDPKIAKLAMLTAIPLFFFAVWSAVRNIRKKIANGLHS